MGVFLAKSEMSTHQHRDLSGDEKILEAARVHCKTNVAVIIHFLMKWMADGARIPGGVCLGHRVDWGC
jgi:hypothetical protein